MALQLIDDDLDEDVAAVPEHRRMFLHNALSGAQRMRSDGHRPDGVRGRGRQLLAGPAETWTGSSRTSWLDLEARRPDARVEVGELPDRLG